MRFGMAKTGNSSYLKIVKIGDVCIKTNVGSTMMCDMFQI